MPSPRVPASASPRIRTLTEALRALDRRQLIDLLTKRPDLTYPLPRDLAELSTRAATPTSIGRALELLNAWLRVVAEGLAALPDPIGVADVADLVGAPAAAVAAATEELRRHALAWGDDDQLHLVRGVRDYFGPYPGGLAPPSLRPLTAEQIEAALADCDDGVRPVLDRLLWSPSGAVRNADRPVDLQSARSPIEELLARQLLRPIDADTVILPREVALRLRGGRFTAEPVSVSPPPVSATLGNPSLVDKAAAGAAFGILHDIELAVHALESTPHRLLRTGGLSSRDITVLARNLGTDAAHASFAMECASAAGLVAPGSNLCLLPTAEYDRWMGRDGAVRWRYVGEGWLGAQRNFSRSAEPGAHVLGPEAAAPGAPGLRMLIMTVAAEAGAGHRIGLDELTEAVRWHRPRTDRGGPIELATLVDWTWREATWLGLTSLGAVSSFAEALTRDAGLPRRLVELFPTPVDRVIVQADLTAIAPGPLPHTIASELRLLADQESRGGGGVYRFSAASLRRGFDAGRSSAEIHAWLERHSTTGIPQPLAYLIDDVARQYGSIRVGSATSYLRTEDEAHAAALLAHPDAGYLGLRPLAPGLLVATADAYEVVAFLRSLGHTPAVEDEAGRTLPTPPQLRATLPRPDPNPRPFAPEDVAGAILAAEQRHPSTPTAEPVETSTEDTVGLLQWATEEAQPVRVSYVAADGTRVERDLSPLDLGAGMLRAVDAVSAQVVNISLARIFSASVMSSPLLD